MMRPRPAPMAERTAISRARPVARANRRFATLAQAISRTNATAPETAQSATLARPRIRFGSRLRAVRAPRRWASGAWRTMGSSRLSSSARAAAGDTPRPSRPMTCTVSQVRHGVKGSSASG